MPRSLALVITLQLFACASLLADRTVRLDVLPAEHRHAVDPKTGAELLYLTSAPGKNVNLYFHERSFLADESMILFTSTRKDGGLMGYLTATGELVRLRTPESGLGSATAARTQNSFYAVHGREIVEAAVHIRTGGGKPTAVELKIHTLCTVPEGIGVITSLNESGDGRKVSFGAAFREGMSGICVVDVRSGALREVIKMPAAGFHGHVQWSRNNPNLLSYAGEPNRLMVVDLRTGEAKPVYQERPGELVTHESWWGNDQILFVGGHRENEWHVKSLDLKTGVARIIGPGSWWPGATNRELAERNWWHAKMSEDERWAAADTFHGAIVLFYTKTCRMVELTQGHRTYGGGEHPHVGWDRKNRRVIFVANKKDGSDVCVATLPRE